MATHAGSCKQELESKKCCICSNNITDRKSYRSLASAVNSQYIPCIEKLNINPVGVLCKFCITKLNKWIRIEKDITTKVDSLKASLDEVISSLKALIKTQVTPTKGPKRMSMRKTPTPKSIKKTFYPRPDGRFRRTLPFTGKQDDTKSDTVYVAAPLTLTVDATTQTDKVFPSASSGQVNPDDSYSVIVKVKEKSTWRTRRVTNEVHQNICRAIVHGRGAAAVVRCLNKKEYKKEMLTAVCSEVKREICVVCRKEEKLLKGLNSSKFDWKPIAERLELLAPSFYQVLVAALTKNMRDDGQSVKQEKQPLLCTSAAVLLYGRNQTLSQLQYTIGLILDQCGATNEALSILNDMGLSVMPTSIHRKKTFLIQRQEEDIKMTVRRYADQVIDEKRKHDRSDSVAPMSSQKVLPVGVSQIKESSKHVDHSYSHLFPSIDSTATLPITDDTTSTVPSTGESTSSVRSTSVTSPITDDTTSAVSSTSVTSPITDDITSAVQSTSVTSPITDDITSAVPSTSVTSPITDDITSAVQSTGDSTSSVRSTSFTPITNDGASVQAPTTDHSHIRVIPPVEILGDNVDVCVTPGVMTSERQRKSFHWFLTLATQKRVTDVNLPCDQPVDDIMKVPSSQWVPSVSEMDTYHGNLQHHVAKILLKHISALKPLEASLPKHIDHPFLDKVSKKSKYVICDLIDANENSSEGMIRILQNIHEKAIPKTDTEVLERLVFGGDVLTNERAFTAQEAVKTKACTPVESLSGVIHRPEGLHREMNFLMSIYQLFYKEKSSHDNGSMYQLRNAVGRKNVSGPKEVTTKFRPHHQFAEDVMEGCVVGEFLTQHAMDDCDASPSSFPVFSLLTPIQQRDWLLDQAGKILQNLQVTDTKYVDSLREDLTALDTDDARISVMFDGTNFCCPICGKKYVRKEWLKTHLKNKHKWQFEQLTTESKECDNPLPTFIRMVLLLHDTVDAYRMADGDRVMRNAKLEWLYAGAMRHSKYKLWLWRMLSYDMALLTPREAFEYRWNISVNLLGGTGKNIPNDNCVELQVGKIKRQLNTQGANKSYNSARVVAMTTQVLDSLKNEVMESSKTAKSSRHRPEVSKKSDVTTIAQSLMSSSSSIAKTELPSFKNFKDPLHTVNSRQLHDWIKEQKKVANVVMSK